MVSSSPHTRAGGKYVIKKDLQENVGNVLKGFFENQWKKNCLIVSELTKKKTPSIRAELWLEILNKLQKKKFKMLKIIKTMEIFC